MAWTKIPKEHHPLFLSAMPDDERAGTIKMFGGIAAMVNGNMAGGLFADTVVVRLDDAGQEKVLGMDGGSLFDPMGKGRPMKDMVLLPSAVLKKPSELRRWLQKAIDYTATLPEKSRKPKAKRAPLRRK